MTCIIMNASIFVIFNVTFLLTIAASLSLLLLIGSGVGFTSLIANALGASEVVITDGNTDVLKIADKNIEINIPVRKSKDIYTSQLRWNIKEDEEKYKLNNRNQPWDYIIAADVTYLKKNRFDLISSIVNLSGPNTISMLSFEPRSVGEVEGMFSFFMFVYLYTYLLFIYLFFLLLLSLYS